MYFHFPKQGDGKDFYDDYLYEYTLMPTHLESYFSAGELQTATCCEGFDFTKGMPVLKVKTYKGAQGCIDPHFVKNNPLGSALYNVQQDPQQQHPIYDQPQTVDTLKTHIVDILQAHDAPAEIYQAYGL